MKHAPSHWLTKNTKSTKKYKKLHAGNRRSTSAIIGQFGLLFYFVPFVFFVDELF